MSSPSDTSSQEAVRAADLFALQRVTSASSSSSSSSSPITRLRTVRGGIKIGNSANIAYGGCAIGNCIHAAFWSLPGAAEGKDDWALYSTSGYYLGPARVDLNTEFEVTTIRSTRTFETRMVKAEQEIPAPAGSGGQPQRRGVMILFADFIRKGGQLNMLRFSSQPDADKITHHEKLKDFFMTFQDGVQSGRFPAQVEGPVRKTFGGFDPIMEIRPCERGVMEDNLYGVLPRVVKSQQDETLPNRSSYTWFRAKEELAVGEKDDILLPPTRSAASAVIMSFYLDAAISFTPLAHQGRSLFEAGACSSLDFSLRFHIDDIDVFDTWNLREIQTHVADVERTYGQTRMWRENDKGELFLAATMTQAGIMRAKKPGSKL